MKKLLEQELKKQSLSHIKVQENYHNQLEKVQKTSGIDFEIPFDKAITLDVSNISKLLINRNRISKLAEFEDSIFESILVSTSRSGAEFSVIRRKRNKSLS